MTPEPTLKMGLPMSNGKLAMWMFLVTEIMFFTALIGVYLILRNGTPSSSEPLRWPKPHEVHLNEYLGAINTFVLICSSFSVVMAHYLVGKKKIKEATMCIAITLALGVVFLGIKAYEYYGKYEHDILPGRMGESLPGMSLEKERIYYPSSMQYVERVRGQLKTIVDAGPVDDVDVKACKELLDEMSGRELVVAGKPSYVSPISPAEVGERANHILHTAEHEHGKTLHIAPAVPFGNLWASCYFVMTGFHALHVLGGLVIFSIILLMALFGKLGPQHESMLELTGLYWHFVDIVWIFLFPLLYLV